MPPGGPGPAVAHNTLPSRVTASPPRVSPPHFSNHQSHPTGRHFKPFDHRKMNPMAEIQENPYEVNHGDQVNYNGIQPDPSYHQPGLVAPQNGDSLPDTTYVVHHNKHVPYMPAELRHTNYNSNNSNN